MKQMIGSVSSFIVGACCLGLTPLLAGLSTLGLSFLINDLILLPLLAIVLAFTLWTLWSSSKRHQNRYPFYLAIVASIVAFAGLWLFVPLSYAGFASLFAVTVWDFWISRQVLKGSQA